MKDITIIIPVHEATEENKQMFNKACKNALEVNPDGNVLIVGPKSVLKELSIPKGVKKVNNEVSDIPHQINAAVEAVGTTYFAFLEIDDYFTPKWFSNAEAYIAENPGCAVYLPLVEVMDAQSGKSGGFINEIVWASSFSETLGYFDYEALQNITNICLSGAIIDTETFKALGALKASMKLYYWYEFVLRVTNKGRKIFTVPKLGYIHTVNRPGSLTEYEMNNISEKEFEWWFTLAQQECQVKTDKGRKYEE